MHFIYLAYHLPMQLSGEEVANLRDLLSAVTSTLQATFDLAQDVGEEVIAAGRELEQVFGGSTAGFDAFTKA